MKTIYSDAHLKHRLAPVYLGGKEIESFERPERAETIKAELEKRHFGPFLAPETFSLDPVLKIHDAGYVSFLQTAHKEWTDNNFTGNAVPAMFNAQHGATRAPKHIEGRMGFYFADSYLSMNEHSWNAIKTSADIALTAQKLMSGGETSAFALCRPPGHHATAKVGGGLCFLNNAAIAAQAFLDAGNKKVAILDVDYHHGNGTQDIFYDRGDVLFVSIHADPYYDYPFFLGHADETGRGKGEGANKNYPLPLGTKWDAFGAAMDDAVKTIAAYKPDILIISLGVDPYKDDPISQFKLENDDFTRIGEKIASLKLPTLFVMEGGYNIPNIGINVANTLEGFLQK